MTFRGIQISDILTPYKFNQSLIQANRNIFEIDGIEFAISFVIDYPSVVKNTLENERARKAALDNLLATKAVTSEGIISVDKIWQGMAGGWRDNRRKHIHVIVSVLYNCLANEAHSAAYYCSKPIAEIKAKFVKTLLDMHIASEFYDAHSVENDIRFSNGSRLVFVESMAS